MTLRKEIVWVLLLKLAVIWGLWWFFFRLPADLPSKQVRTEQRILGAEHLNNPSDPQKGDQK